jgi:hypothetical protein
LKPGTTYKPMLRQGKTVGKRENPGFTGRCGGGEGKVLRV